MTEFNEPLRLTPTEFNALLRMAGGNIRKIKLPPEYYPTEPVPAAPQQGLFQVAVRAIIHGLFGGGK